MIRRKVEQGGAHPPPRPAAAAEARPALRRPAPAGRHRPRHRARAEDLPLRRAACPTSTPRCAPTCASSSPACTRQLGATMIYVTHDQIEAMTMADRIVVLNAGDHRPGRHADAALPRAGERLRGAVHRQSEDEPPARHLRRRRAGGGDGGDGRPAGADPGRAGRGRAGPGAQARRSARSMSGSARAISRSPSRPPSSSGWASRRSATLKPRARRTPSAWCCPARPRSVADRPLADRHPCGGLPPLRSRRPGLAPPGRPLGLRRLTRVAATMRRPPGPHGRRRCSIATRPGGGRPGTSGRRGRRRGRTRSARSRGGRCGSGRPSGRRPAGRRGSGAASASMK